MAFVFNIMKGRFAEKVADSASNVLLLLLSAKEADDALKDHVNLSVLLGAAGNTEVVDASYARKTGITGTLTVDNANNRAEVDVPDQTFTALDGPDPVAGVFAYEESAADTGRVPGTMQEFAVTTTGTNVTMEINAAGIFRAQDL